MELIHRFIHLSPSGDEWASLTVERLWDGVYYLERTTPSRNLGDAAPAIWVALFRQAIDYGESLHASEFRFRTVSNQIPLDLIQWVTQARCQKKHDRIEFRATIDELPGDDENPIIWRAVDSLSPEVLNKTGELIQQVGVGDPDYDPKEDPVALLKCYLGDPVLTSGPNCIHLGSREGRVMSVVIAQINPKTGWSRITNMGMLPEFRGQGLGKWVHRHGFKMMREQGGKLYQGGTVSSNERMLKLFHENGCKEYRRMQEWTYKF